MDQRIITVIQYIEEHLNSKLELNKIAQKACMSPFHFHRLFKQETTIPVKRFIESLKMEKAFQALLQPLSKVQDIALDLGYNDSETFSRAFKRTYKVSPNDLKKIIQKAMSQLDISLDVNQCFIVAFSEDSPAQITKKIMTAIKKKDLGKEETLETVKVFSAKPSAIKTPNNKFIVKEDIDTFKKLTKIINK